MKMEIIQFPGRVKAISLIIVLFTSFGVLAQKNAKKPIVIDETAQKETISQVIKIDEVWAGHPVGFCLLTHGNRQYIAYYNADRNMVLGQRNLGDDQFELHVMPATSRETHGGTSTVIGWDSHNYVTLAVDKEGYIHLSGNMHVDPLTYFRSDAPHDISAMTQIMEMVGSEEKRCTYPIFIKDRNGELIFTYRDGSSGSGNQIYNIYDCDSKSWSRLLDTPLTDGKGLMNAYISRIALLKDNWYHSYWVWRDTPDCATNHDLSYMKSPDLKHWYDAFGNPITLPATLDQRSLIVDPIPVKGGIINLAAKLCLDDQNRPAFVYHKYDLAGKLQFYSAWLNGKKWQYTLLTDWDYRWEFSGNGSINSEVVIRDFYKRPDGYFAVDYWHTKYGEGTILLNKKFGAIGKVLKPPVFKETVKVEGDFPELLVQTSEDIGDDGDPSVRYVLKWETIPRNRDRPRPEPWPGPSQLYLYKLTK
jgi:hypothetical protein